MTKKIQNILHSTYNACTLRGRRRSAARRVDVIHVVCTQRPPQAPIRQATCHGSVPSEVQAPRRSPRRIPGHTCVEGPLPVEIIGVRP